MLLGFEHVGMTVSDMDRAIDFYCGLLGLRLALRRTTAGGDLAFLDAGGGMLEVARDAYNTEMIRRVAFVRDPDGILVELIERAPGR